MLLLLQAVEVGVSGGVADEEDVVDGEELMAVIMGQMDIEISDQEGVASVGDMASGGGSGNANEDGGIPVVAAPTVNDKQEDIDDEVSSEEGTMSKHSLFSVHVRLFYYKKHT